MTGIDNDIGIERGENPLLDVVRLIPAVNNDYPLTVWPGHQLPSRELTRSMSFSGTRDGMMASFRFFSMHPGRAACYSVTQPPAFFWASKGQGQLTMT